MEMIFFRACRGEGKTKWLFDQAIRAREAKVDIWYVGNRKTMDSLSKMWIEQFHELCPIKNIGEWRPAESRRNVGCFLTDGLIENIEMVGFWKKVVDDINGVWYITMDKECFID